MSKFKEKNKLNFKNVCDTFTVGILSWFWRIQPESKQIHKISIVMAFAV